MNNMTGDETIADRIKKFILSAVGTGHGAQKQFAEKLKCSTPVISQWVKGIRPPSEKMIYRMTEFYSLNRNWLLTGEGEMFEKEIIQIKISEGETSIPVHHWQIDI